MSRTILFSLLFLAAVACGKSEKGVDGVTLPPALELEIGEDYILVARVWPVDAANQAVTWESDTPAVATVDRTSGQVKAVALGEAKIVGTTVDGGKKATCTVTVIPVQPNALDDITDPVFRLYLEEFDTNKNGKISPKEAAEVKTLSMSRADNQVKIQSLAGIENFPNLEKLIITGNSLKELSLPANTALKHLYCGNNSLTTLDVAANVELLELICNANSLEAIDISALSKLKFLHCGNNRLTTFDISGSRDLYYFNCEGNPGVLANETDTQGVFEVGAWFTNAQIPTGSMPGGTTYLFTRSWEITVGGKTKNILVDYQKITSDDLTP